MKLSTRIKSVILAVATVAVGLGCGANDKSDMKQFLETHKQIGYGKVLSDSISSIVLDADKITCRLISYAPADSVDSEKNFMVVPSLLSPIVKFLFLNEQNFQSNDVVYGRFQPWVNYTFDAGDQGTVHLEMDFGLRKWRLLNDGNKQIFGGDMREMNMQFLSLTRLLFPEDETLKMLNDNLMLL